MELHACKLQMVISRKPNHMFCGVANEESGIQNNILLAVETTMNEKTLAKFFYEQCAGTHSGHMANIANNPVLFGLIRAASGRNDNCYAATQTEFAKMLREMADQLDS